MLFRSFSFTIGSSGGGATFTKQISAGLVSLGRISRGVSGFEITLTQHAYRYAGQLLLGDPDNQQMALGQMGMIWNTPGPVLPTGGTFEYRGMTIEYSGYAKSPTQLTETIKIHDATTVALDVYLYIPYEHTNPDSPYYWVPSFRWSYTGYQPLHRLHYYSGPFGRINNQIDVVQYVPHGGSGSSVTAVASPGYYAYPEGFYFAGWSDGNGSATRTDTNITSDRYISASFPQKKRITVTANNATKVYGSADPTFTWTVSGLDPGDTVTGELSRSSGESVDFYQIQKGSLSAGSKYNISFVPASLAITPKPLDISATADDKGYDETTLTSGDISLEGVIGTDSVTATGTFEFEDAALGANKTVNVSNITLTGSAADNYVPSVSSVTTTATIYKDRKSVV